MADSERAVERWMRKLVVQGERQGGFVTYQALAEVPPDLQLNETLEILDRIHEILSARGIQIVDELPATIPERIRREPAHPHRADERRHVIRLRRWQPSEEIDREPSLCSEDAIDILILRWEETGAIREQELSNLVNVCKLSKAEVKELEEYLESRGIDLPRKASSLWERLALEEKSEPVQLDPYILSLARQLRTWRTDLFQDGYEL